MRLHTTLFNDVDAFDFTAADLAPLKQRHPHLEIVVHHDHASLLQSAVPVDCLLTWEFEVDWYDAMPQLHTILTPAAGNDWVAADPRGKVKLVHGTFHGDLLRESMLSAILFMNHRMPAMMDNFRQHAWDRNLQTQCRLLKQQTVLIVGLGHIGLDCARLLRHLCQRVIGIKQTVTVAEPGIEVMSTDALDAILPVVDHVVLLLPANRTTDGLFDANRLRRCKPGAFIYNFGRGNVLASDDLMAAMDHLGGAFLDVVDEEPLPPASPLWTTPNIMITPHSSCIYQDYKQSFIAEVAEYFDRI